MIYDTYFQRLSWDDDNRYDFRDFEGKLLTVMAEMDYDEHFARMAEAFWKGSVARNVYRVALQGLSPKEEGRRWNLVRALCEADLNDPIPWDMEIFWADHIGADADYHELLSHYFGQSNPLESDTALWEVARMHGIDPVSVIAEMPFPVWRRCVDSYVLQEDLDSTALLWFLKQNAAEKAMEQPHRLYADFRLRLYLFKHQKTDAPGMQEQFIKSALGFYGMLYDKTALTVDNKRLPEACLLALRMRKRDRGVV